MPPKPLDVDQVLSLNRSALPLSLVPADADHAQFPPVLTSTVLSRIN
jgi:hypothetical protein